MSVLLGGIILSNAYKNTNVYNMVVPRKPILYQRFDELQKDNFNVYSRSTEVAILPILRSKIENKVLEMSFKNTTKSAQVITEMQKAVRNLQRVGKISGAAAIAHSNLLKQGVSRTSLHPHILPMFKDVSKQAFHRIPKRSRSRLMSSTIKNSYPRMKSMEELILLRAIEECRNTAIFLPDYECIQYRKILVKERKLKNIFIVEESFSDVDCTFSLGGLVPPYVIRRIYGIAESGVWHWWIQVFARSTIDNSRETIPVQVANMSGSIIVIFALWACGILGTTLCFLIEVAGELSKSIASRLISLTLDFFRKSSE